MGKKKVKADGRQWEILFKAKKAIEEFERKYPEFKAVTPAPKKVETKSKGKK